MTILATLSSFSYGVIPVVDIGQQEGIDLHHFTELSAEISIGITDSFQFGHIIEEHLPKLLARLHLPVYCICSNNISKPLCINEHSQR